ncbi:hypothetical protein [Paractinoplanes globisporus]|uniref:Uncharacterized protein n=1 Tax=Paractinoplanes globisporus TaxID=113565 RepID=A0ABW6W746_9ACTN|nr:hypothetical protein [Actinoplanes globisporus]
MTPSLPARHPATWWAEFQQHAEQFDLASVTETLLENILPRIPSMLLRREAEIAGETVMRHLNKPASPELAERAGQATDRLVATVERIAERSLGGARTIEAYAICRLLRGEWAAAAAATEPVVGTLRLIQAVVAALRLNTFGSDLAVRLLKAGHAPAAAILAGRTIGRYSWWPDWMQSIVIDRAVAGALDEEVVAALQTCAFASLSPAQARMAKRLIAAEATLVEATAYRLEALGEHPAAHKLRRGDLDTVAFAARLIPV